MEDFTVRPVTAEDIREARKLGSLAWLGPCDLDKESDPKHYSNPGEIGLFTPGGEMAASITEVPFDIYFDGKITSMNGIAGVSTKPEYRYGGAIRKLFSKVFDNSTERGDVFSVLFPFSHKFYRKFGYEMFCYRHNYRIENDMLSQLRVSSPIRRIEFGEELEFITDIHNEFIRKYNMGVRRTVERTKQDNRGDTYKDLVSHFIIGDGAYVSYKLSRNNPSQIDVYDWAFTDEKYIPDILALFGRYSPMIRNVELSSPPDIALEAYVESASKLVHTVNYGPMVRVTDVEKALSLAQNNDNADFTISVTDDAIEKNNGTWRVCGGKAARTEAPADISCDIRALAPMLLGAYGFSCAKARDDVTVNGNEASLKSFFTAKNIYLDDSF